MFIIHAADLADFVGERQVKFHSFADNSQTYLCCSSGEVDSAVCQLDGCITEICYWISASRILTATRHYSTQD